MLEVPAIRDRFAHPSAGLEADLGNGLGRRVTRVIMPGLPPECSSLRGSGLDARLVEEFPREARHIRQEMAKLRAESRERSLQFDDWNETRRWAMDRHGKREIEVDRLQATNRLLQARLFGRQNAQTGTGRRLQLMEGTTINPRRPFARAVSPGSVWDRGGGIMATCPSSRSDGRCLPSTCTVRGAEWRSIPMTRRTPGSWRLKSGTVELRLCETYSTLAM